jgi:8-oxo-dGTP pyrophosphatase MutT (NUDIX family)
MRIMPEKTPAPAHPAATVVLVRDVSSSCEVLLVRRNAQLAFHGGAWVFPGGRIDDGDRTGVADVVEAARRAAVREAAEEAGVAVSAEEMLLISRWITPEPLPKRFDTWFFVAPAGDQAVQIDGGEIHAHRWFAPAEALESFAKGEIDLPPPTFVTLLQLSQLGSLAAVFDTYRGRPHEEFLPRLRTTADAAFTLYSGDIAYDGGDVDAPGPRHRLRMVGTNWTYLREGL